MRIVRSTALSRSRWLRGWGGCGRPSTRRHHFGLADEGGAFANEKFRGLKVPNQLGLGLQFAAFGDDYVPCDASGNHHGAGVNIALYDRLLADDHTALGFDFAFDFAFESEGLAERKSPFDFDVA